MVWARRARGDATRQEGPSSGQRALRAHFRLRMARQSNCTRRKAWTVTSFHTPPTV
jgi:hypothetical protein